MKYTSPFKRIIHQELSNHQSAYQNSPFKDSPFLNNSLFQNLESFQSKSNGISYFKKSKYKVTDKSQQSPNKSILRQRSSSPSDRLGKIGKLLENITNKHQQMKSKLTHLKQNASKSQENEEECTFTPHIIHNPKYVIPSSLDQRTKQWQDITQHRGQSKARRYTSIKQELVTQQVKECTFTPKLISKPQSTKILKEKALEQQRLKEERGESYSKDKQISTSKRKGQKSFKKETKSTPYRAIDIKNIKELIKQQVSRIKFDY